MIRRSPSEYYIKYLVVHPDGYDNDRIRSICTRLDIEILGNWYLDQLRSTVRPPSPFFPQDPSHWPSQKFIQRECLRSIFAPNESMLKAQQILEKPRLRELVEVMVLSGAPSEAISRALAVRARYICDEHAITLYRHYFWDIDLLDSNEMRAFLKLRLDAVAGSNDPEIKAQYTHLTKSRYTDPRVVAARLPTSPLSALLSQVQMGVLPKGVHLQDVLESVRFMASLRALEASTVGGPQGAGDGQGYMVTADIANRLLETIVKPEDQLRKDLMNISLKLSGKTVPVIAELTGGRHTVDLQPEPKPVGKQLKKADKHEGA
jgi:hypothetical protein